MSYTIRFPIDGKNSYLCKVCGKFSLTTDKDKAEKYGQKEKAENILKSSLSKTFPYKKKGEIVYIEDEAIEVKTDIVKKDYTKIDFDQFQKDFDDLSEQFRSIKSNKNSLVEQLSEADRKISDIEHYLEFYTFNACDGYKLAKGLKEILMERRKIKNQFKIIEALENSTCSEMMSGIASVKMNQAIKGDYDYAPRVLKGMFKGKEKIVLK